MVDRTEEQLIRYMKSATFRRRSKRTQKRVLASVRAGNPLSIEEIAKELRLPLDVVKGGLEHSLAKFRRGETVH